jgi:stage II sporulation protein AA (anti-sigma F factor antagonist)
MKITGFCKEGVLTLNFSGELDHHSARAAMKALSDRIDAFMPRECVLNFKELTFMDSSGIALILRADKRMKEIDGRLYVVSVPSQPMRVLGASGIEKLIKITNK